MYRVLIVEPDELTRRALCVLIGEEEAFSVAGCVETGEDALALCSREPIDAAMVALSLPGLSGMETGRAIHRLYPDAAIALLSAFSSVSFLKDALNARTYNYIAKPLSRREVTAFFDSCRARYPEKRPAQDELLGRLLAILDQRQYNALPELLPGIVHEVMLRSAENHTDPSAAFRQLAERVFSAVYPGPSGSTRRPEPPPISHARTSRADYWFFYLTDVMDQAFRLHFLRRHEDLAPVFSLIDAQLKTDLNLNILCQTCKISQSYLSKLFRAYLGVSVMDYIHLKKLAQAKMYMAFTDLTITEISYRMGYNDSSYFSKVFKKYEGMAPKQYQMCAGKAAPEKAGGARTGAPQLK